MVSFSTNNLSHDQMLKSCRIGVRHVLYYVECFVIIFLPRHSLVWTRQAGPLLRVRVTTLGPVPVSPEAGTTWA